MVDVFVGVFVVFDCLEYVFGLDYLYDLVGGVG